MNDLQQNVDELCAKLERKIKRLDGQVRKCLSAGAAITVSEKQEAGLLRSRVREMDRLLGAVLVAALNAQRAASPSCRRVSIPAARGGRINFEQQPLAGMRHLKFVINCALVVSSIGAFAQDSARTVQYHSQDIVPIRAKVKYTTLIELPTTEKIMEAATGDKEFWIVDVVGNFCFVHPAKAGHQLQLESH